MTDNTTDLTLSDYNIKILPDYLPPSTENLIVDMRQLIRLPPLPARLTNLHIYQNPLTNLPVLPNSLTELIIEQTPLTSLPVLPVSLTKLIIQQTPLTSLPVLPNSLTKLYIEKTLLTSLPVLPNCLKELHIATTPLTSLPVLPNSLTDLNILKTSLTSLPELPTSLKELGIINTQLDSLPELPASLTMLLIYHTLLTRLPVLPASLTKLNIYNTSLTHLQDLPASLKELRIYHTPLTNLPELPNSLTKLEIKQTQLTSLPELPNSLTRLDIQNTPLTSLPEMPASLEDLFIIDTPLTSLPELPPGLTRLLVISSALTSLPESISRLPSNAEVTLSRNPLSERTRQALRDMTVASDYLGPMIRFDMEGPSAPHETRPLHLAVADWLAPAVEGESPSAHRWQAFGQEDNAASFSRFLDRLSETVNCKKHSGFKDQISSWLTQLAEDNELRARTFAMATEATSSCEDRVTLALNQMKSVQLVHNAEKGGYDNHLSGLVSVGREMFRLEKLEQIAREKVKMMRFVDEIEVYLGYQNKLKNPLELTSVTEEMRFFDVSYITESDLQAAELQVKTAENSEFRNWILQWEPLHSVLKRAEPTRWKTLCEKKKRDYRDAYQTLLATELKLAGLLGNPDAERTVGARALAIAEKEFQKGLASMTKVSLGGLLDAK